MSQAKCHTLSHLIVTAMRMIGIISSVLQMTKLELSPKVYNTKDGNSELNNPCVFFYYIILPYPDISILRHPQIMNSRAKECNDLICSHVSAY